MKILLINPPERNMLDIEMPEVLEEGIGFTPPLGVMIIGACVQKFTDWDVEIIDAVAEQLNYKQLGARIKQSKPDAVGITALSNLIYDCTLTARVVKKIDNDIPVILGGPHVNIYPDETINFPFVDYLIMGEGEFTIGELLKNIGDTEKLKHVKGIYFKDENGKAHSTGMREFIKDLDEVPFPARNLVKTKLYGSTIARRNPTSTTITSRGCPYKCIFCDRPHLGKGFRARSAQNVVDEFEECVDKGIGEVLIYDDTFTINRQRVVDICKEMKRRKLDIYWDVRARVNTVDYKLLKLMKSAGCTRIHYGVEAGNPHILKIINKGITREQAIKAFAATKKAGIETLGYFMIGNPRETVKTVKDTIRFAKKLDPNYCHFRILMPMPATPVYQMGIDEGILSGDLWRKYAANPTKEFKPEFWIENMTMDKMKDLMKQAYKEFYLRPSYVIKSALRVRSPSEFIRKTKAGLKVFKASS